jgi:uncharacterized protein YecE (DUF72 family)
MKQHFWIGTSGFQYKEWTKQFYPEGLPQKRWLEYYAEHFNSVEINNSFYRLPQTKTFAGWAERTPPDFRFAIKGSQYITHRLRLKDPGPHVKLFFERAKAMEQKLGAVLWQLPANLTFNVERLALLAQALKQHSLGRQALEVRHDSWFVEEAYKILRHYNVALVIAHSSKWPYHDDVKTADFLYVRFHGAPRLYASNYSDKSLQEWAKKLKDLAGGDDIYAYFNNDANIHAPDNAKTLRELLS